MDVLLQRQHAGKQSVRLAFASFVVVNAAEDNRRSQFVLARLDLDFACALPLD